MDDLTKYRLDNAKEKLESAKLLLDAGHYRDSIGRSYYAIFTAVRAILAKDKVDFSKHAGVKGWSPNFFPISFADILVFLNRQWQFQIFLSDKP